MIYWRFKKFQGKKESLLRIAVTVPDDWNSIDWAKPPISLKFTLPMWTSSGVVVNFLKVVEREGYKTYKWIRSMTTSGEYTYRLK